MLSANQLFSLIDVKRKFINSDNHTFYKSTHVEFKTLSAVEPLTPKHKYINKYCTDRVIYLSESHHHR
jgi:hypothetical protein